MSSATMYDDVNVSLLPPGTAVAGGYIGGTWPNAAEIRRKFPRGKVIDIAVSASEDGDCLDVENGDATNVQAPGWFKRRECHTLTPKPWLYTSASNIAALVATMQRAGIARDRYFIWSAHYTYKQHICSPSACGYPKADGTQWTDKALGRSLDQSLVQTYMLPGFRASAPAKKAPTPPPAKKSAPAHPVVADARGDLTTALKNPKNRTLRGKILAALKAIAGIK